MGITLYDTDAIFDGVYCGDDCQQITLTDLELNILCHLVASAGIPHLWRPKIDDIQESQIISLYATLSVALADCMGTVGHCP